MSLGERDSAAVRIPPPLVYAAAILLGGLLQRLVLRLPVGLPGGVRIAASIGAIGFGIGFVLVAIALFRRDRQDPTPWTSTPGITARGVYRLSRNPMYLGMALVQGGVGLAYSNGWVILLLPVSLLAVYWTAIRPEEAYLERKFGDTYLDYKRSVRRWI